MICSVSIHVRSIWQDIVHMISLLVKSKFCLLATLHVEFVSRISTLCIFYVVKRNTHSYSSKRKERGSSYEVVFRVEK